VLHYNEAIIRDANTRRSKSYAAGLRSTILLPFSSLTLDGKYDYKLCLSLLHHSLFKKDLWKVLIEEAFPRDRLVLRQELQLLGSSTADKGNVS
jgi:hypothetical protein